MPHSNRAPPALELSLPAPILQIPVLGMQQQRRAITFMPCSSGFLVASGGPWCETGCWDIAGLIWQGSSYVLLWETPKEGREDDGPSAVCPQYLVQIWPSALQAIFLYHQLQPLSFLPWICLSLLFKLLIYEST